MKPLALQACPFEECDGTGWKPVVIDNVRRVQRCACWQEKQRKFAEGVPLEFRDATLETYTETPANYHALKLARKWIEQPESDLYVFGPVGSGKSRLAASLLNEHFARTRTGFFARVPMLLLRLQPGDAEQAELFWRCAEVPLLVLDDLGAERETATDFTRRTLLMLYEERGDRGLRTIWTSNKSLGEIGDFMQDERLVSRIAGRSEVIELAGTDWRLASRTRGDE